MKQLGHRGFLSLFAFLMMSGMSVAAQRLASELEPVVFDAADKPSALIDPSLFMDFGARPVSSLFTRPATSPPVNFLRDKSIPVKLENLADEPQFAPYIMASISELTQQAGRLDSDANAWTVLGVRLYQTNQVAESIAALQRAREIDPQHERSAELYSALLVHAGDLDEAHRQTRRMLDILPHNRILRFNAACGYALSTNASEALYHLGVLADLGWHDVWFHLDDPDLDTIRKTPEFQRLAENLDRKVRERVVDQLRVKH
jgi:tetratricopeptide (TPR) repeat protein